MSLTEWGQSKPMNDRVRVNRRDVSSAMSSMPGCVRWNPSVRMPGPWIDPRPAYFIVGHKPAAS